MVAPRSVDASLTTLDELLARVENEHLPLRIIRNGQPVAELRPIYPAGNGNQWVLPEIDAELKPQINRQDALAPLDENDWPSEERS